MKSCPAALIYSRVNKLQGPPVPAMERGTAIHALAEHYLNGNITGGVPMKLRKLSREFKALKAKKPIVEKYWGVSAEWKPMNYGWCVAKTDAYVPPKVESILDVIDHKTGRIYPSHPDQASLYAAIGYALFPKVEEIHVAFFYIDEGFAPSYEYTRSKLRYSVKYWREEGLKLMATTNFLPTPSPDACGWCGFRSDKKLANGKPGPCNAWRVLR
jgi:hypothetical protein